MCESEMLKVCEAKEKIKWLNEKIRIRKVKTKLEMYIKEKEKCEMFFKYVKAKCKSEMQKYVKVKKMLSKYVFKNISCFVTYR